MRCAAGDRVATILLGASDDGTAVEYPAFAPSLLITGTSGTGKSTLAGVFVERLVSEEYVICLLDPEGDYHSLAEQEGVVVLKSEPGTEESRAQEVEQLLRHRSTSVAIDLSALDRQDKIRAAAHPACGARAARRHRLTALADHRRGAPSVSAGGSP
jgi:DNA helicase HerA-like ATPase